MARVRSDEKNYNMPVGVDAVVTRITPTNSSLVSQMHGRFYELARLGNLFYVANQAAVTTTIALAATYTGLCVSNPAGNNKNLVIEAVSWKLSVAPAGVATVYLIGGYSVEGIVTHTTPLVFGTAFATLNLGSSQAPTALCDAAATIVNPRVLMPLTGGFTAAALFPDGLGMVDLGGAVRCQPGGWVGIGTLTVAIGFGGFWWSEEVR